jgi:hypothetical protein
MALSKKWLLEASISKLEAFHLPFPTRYGRYFIGIEAWRGESMLVSPLPRFSRIDGISSERALRTLILIRKMSRSANLLCFHNSLMPFQMRRQQFELSSACLLSPASSSVIGQSFDESSPLKSTNPPIALLLGDTNIESAAELDPLLKDGPFIDTYSSLNDTPETLARKFNTHATFWTTYRIPRFQISPVKRIDYILLCAPSPLRVVQSRRLGQDSIAKSQDGEDVFYSDHLGVVTLLDGV